MRGREIVEIARRRGWEDHGPGAEHPYILKRPRARRPVPVRDRLENRFEVQGILKQLEIPREDWPEKVR
jgi:hypothetical protein